MAATIVDFNTVATRKSKGANEAIQPASERLYWRAVVRTGTMFAASREGDRVEWHLADCAEPHGTGAHCSQGLYSLEVAGQPEGHCVVNGACGRCGESDQERTRLAA